MGGFGGKGFRSRRDVRGTGARPHRLALAVYVLVLMISLFALSASVGYAASGTSAGKATSAGDQYDSVVVVKAAVAKQTKPKSASTKPASTKPASTKSASTKPAVVATSAGLPFTGISLAGTAVLGIGLVGLGVMLRRRERHDES